MKLGFLADKLGNYKIILMIYIFLAGFTMWSIIWLPHDYENFLMTVNQNNNYSSNISKRHIENIEESFSPNAFTFPVLFIIRMLGFFLMDSTNMLMDSCGLALCKKHNGNIGQQKMWSPFSVAVFPLICGILIDAISDYRGNQHLPESVNVSIIVDFTTGFRDYSVAFYICLGCAITAVWTISQMDVVVQQNKKSLIKTAKAVIGMVDVDIFFLTQIVLGTCWGWHMNFFSVYVDTELKASKTLFGNNSNEQINPKKKGCNILYKIQQVYH